MNSAIVLKEALRVGRLSSLYLNKWQVTGEVWDSLIQNESILEIVFSLLEVRKKDLTEKEFQLNKIDMQKNRFDTFP